jgi:ferrochelatase
MLVNFGEPDRPDLGAVTDFMERIFAQNASLDGNGAGSAVARARELASKRAPGLLREYERIGGSPLNVQANAQARSLGSSLSELGIEARVYSAFQFTEPLVADVVRAAREDGVDTLVAVTGYPLCGQSTTVAAIDAVQTTLDELGWQPRFLALSGWHHHPGYFQLRVDNIDAFVRTRGLDLEDPETLLYFSAHGTPVSYLRQGNRYDRYVLEHCRQVARGLGATRFATGFQNHANRGIAWTRPDNEDRIREIAERRLVIVPISFMKEQSETLFELDHELREFVETMGKEYHRVPVPWDAPAFGAVLADLIVRLVSDDPEAGSLLSPCRCRAVGQTWCTNGTRYLPPSPYAPVQHE